MKARPAALPYQLGRDLGCEGCYGHNQTERFGAEMEHARVAYHDIRMLFKGCIGGKRRAPNSADLQRTMISPPAFSIHKNPMSSILKRPSHRDRNSCVASLLHLIDDLTSLRQ